MKFLIEQHSLLKTLTHIQSIVEKRNTVPILGHVCLRASGSMLSFHGTDMDLELVEQVPVLITTEGETTTPVHTLYEIVRRLPSGGQVQFEMETDSQLVLTSGNSRFVLSCLDVADFPSFGSDSLPQQFSLPSADLLRLLDKTHFAMSTDDTRHYLNGVYIHVIKENDVDLIRGVATDGHRLACVDAPMPFDAKNIDGFILPRKAVAELTKLLEKASESVQVSLSKSRIAFAFQSLTLTSKLVDGTFPDYKRVIPTDAAQSFSIKNKAFRDIIDLVSVISSDKVRSVTLQITGNTLRVLSSNMQGDNAEDEITLDMNLDDLKIAFNAQYLLDIAGQLGETLSVSFSTASRPAILQDVADPLALYVLMPMRI